MAGSPPYDDETWDEERWEAFLRDNDRRVDRFMELFFRFTRRYPQPDPSDEAAQEAWKASLRTFLREKGWREDVAPFFWFGQEADPAEADNPFLAGDELLFEEEGEGLYDPEQLPVYLEAVRLSSSVLDWANGLSGRVKNSSLVHYCSHLTQIPAHLAHGHSLGRERDMLGGNIACAKRGLADANAALELLRQMRRAPYMDEDIYGRLYEQTYEVRNALALHILDLREQFDLGID